MFVVAKWSTYTKMESLKDFKNRTEAKMNAESGTTFEQVDIYEVVNPDEWKLLEWKPFGEGMQFIINKTRGKGV